MTSRFVINGHGINLNHAFKLSQSRVISPSPLHSPYILKVERETPLEPAFKQGKLYPVESGQWTHYDSSKLTPNVFITPWGHEETILLFERAVLDDDLWSTIDGQYGSIFERDPDLFMIIKENGIKKVLQGDALFDYMFDALTMNFFGWEFLDDEPLFIASPHLGKIKPLGYTTLQEVVTEVEHHFGKSDFFVATCNASLEGDDHVVKLEPNKPAMPIKPVNALRFSSHELKPYLNDVVEHSTSSAPSLAC